MTTLTRRIGRLIPESRFKDFLRVVKHPVEYLVPESRFKNILRVVKPTIIPDDRISFKYSFKEDNFTLEFNVGILKGHTLHLPHQESKHLVVFSCKHILSYFQKEVMKKGDIIIDAGAYPGDFTTIASRIVGEEGRVLAFEPNPENRSYLEEVLETNNHYPNVEIFDQALYSSQGTSRLLKRGSDSRIIDNRRNYSSIIEVETTTIDTVLKDMNLMERISLIKMDIEGAEIEAVKGAEETIRTARPIFLIASYHVKDGQMTCVPLEEMFKQFGYDVEHLYDAHLTTYAIPN